MKENERLIAKYPVNRYQADFEKTETPVDWAGRSFPAALPGDLALDESSTDQDSAVWQDQSGFYELTFSGFPTGETLAVAREIIYEISGSNHEERYCKL